MSRTPTEQMIAAASRVLEMLATRGLDMTQEYVELLVATDRLARQAKETNEG